MINLGLTRKEIRRVRRAASFAGIPWRPICARPEAARAFYRRVEGEMRSRGIEPEDSEPRNRQFLVAAMLQNALSSYGRLISQRI